MLLISYSYDLALYRRITIPLKFMLSSKIRMDNSIIKNFPITSDINKLVDEYFPIIFPLEKNNNKKKMKIHGILSKLTLRFWCAGYSLYAGTPNKQITNRILKEAVEYSNPSRRVQLYLFGQFLNLDPKSPVINPPQRNKTTPSLDLERKKWELILEKNNSKLASDFYSYFFGSLLDRTKSEVILEQTINNNLNRISFSKISVSSWSAHSYGLRKVIELASSLHIINTKGLIDGLSEIFQEDTFLNYSKSNKGSIRSTLRQYVEYYLITNNIKLSLDKVFPKSFRRKSTVFGKIINLGNASELVSYMRAAL